MSDHLPTWRTAHAEDQDQGCLADPPDRWARIEPALQWVVVNGRRLRFVGNDLIEFMRLGIVADDFVG